jgi:hypothetical protein
LPLLNNRDINVDMSEYSKAFVVGGWSEDCSSLTGLIEEITTGPHSFVDDADPLTLAEVMRRNDAYNTEFARRIVITHSAGIMAVHRAGVVIAMNGPERTSLTRLIRGAGEIAVNIASAMHEDQAAPIGLTNGLREVFAHPITMTIPFRVGYFSTVRKLIDGKANYTDGRAYLVTTEDEFGFGENGEVSLARQHGLVAQMYPGSHNQHLWNPRAGAGQIRLALNDLAIV